MRGVKKFSTKYFVLTVTSGSGIGTKFSNATVQGDKVCADRTTTSNYVYPWIDSCLNSSTGTLLGVPNVPTGTSS
eukprot:SAG31_NODE_8559_length_1430_cov_2.766341_1_plen_75_part_00